MATLTYDQDSPGQGGSGPLFGTGTRPTKVATGRFSFDNSYPTNGESVTGIFDLFNDANGTSRLDGLFIEQPLSGAQTGKFLRVDYTNKKLLLYTNASPAVEVANASDQSAITNLRWIAWGKR